MNDQLRELIDLMGKANGMNRDAASANIDYQDTVRDVDEQIRNIANGIEGFARGFDITTEAGAANKSMLIELAQNAWDAATAQLELDGDTAAFTATLEEQRQKLYDAAIQMGASETEAANLRDTLLAMPDAKTIQVYVETAWAETKIGALWNSLNNLAGTTWNIPVKTTVDGAGTVLAPGFGSANGNVVTYHANGSVTENHVAQIARAGDYRVWAEDETGGESYIPHAKSKLPRSEQIMAETARILGGTYIPAGARQYADGAVVSEAPASGPINVILSSQGGIDLLQYVDVRVEQGEARLTDTLRSG